MARARRLGGPGYPLVERTRGTVTRHDMLEREESLVVAVSGGPDSTCLLDVLARLPLDLDLHVAHVDHGLDERSSEVARDVARRAATDGFDVHVVRAPELAGPNLQARARDFRYGFLEAVAKELGARRIATGHTLDDRAETTLARLVHGAGLDALAGLQPVEGARVRPLIESRRRETRAYCVERSLEFVDDPANSDPRFERSAVRHKLLAAIEQSWGEGAVRAIATSAQRLSEDSDALWSIVERLYPEVVSADQAEISIAIDALRQVPRALRRRVLEKAVGRVRDRSGGIDALLDALDRPFDGPKIFAVAAGIRIALESRRVIVRHRHGSPAGTNDGSRRAN
jgi:tRNA(Ile)-lysidine synthase